MNNPERLFNIGDLVWCTESGVRGTVLHFYKPTACEEQTIVETDDGKGQYHAPTSTWKLYTPEINYMEAAAAFVGIDLASGQDMTGNMLNMHGEYVLKFATNHGISIAEAHEEPMVKAHLAYFNSIIRDEVHKGFGVPERYLRSCTD